MAAFIKIDTLSNAEKKIITKECLVLAEEKFIKRRGNLINTNEESFLSCKSFFHEDGIPKIKLPFGFANTLRKKFYNLNFPHYSFSKNIFVEEDCKLKKNQGMNCENKIKFLGKPRVKDGVDQKEVIEEAQQHLADTRCANLELPTSSGKTFMGTYILSKLGYRTCILNYRETIQRSWVNAIRKYLGENIKIWIVGDKYEFDDRQAFTQDEGIFMVSNESYTSSEMKKGGPDIILCLVGSIHKIPEELRKTVGTLVIDEVHRFMTQKSIEAMMSFNPRYMITLSATQKLANGLEMAIPLFVGKNKVVRKSIKPYEVYIIYTGLQFALKKIVNGKPSETYSTYTHLMDQHETSKERFELIEKLVRHNPEKKIMIMNKRKKMCEMLEKIIPEETASLYGNKKSYKDTRILMGTDSKMGTGFDEENFCEDEIEEPSNMGIITFTNAEEAPFTQIKGRLMRCEDPKIVYLIDENPICKSHLRKMRVWIEETCGKIFEHYYDKKTYENEEYSLNLEDIKSFNET